MSVYLPEDLYRAARDPHLSISALAQRAIAEALRTAGVDRWVAAVQERAPRVTRVLDASAAVAGAREEFGA